MLVCRIVCFAQLRAGLSSVAAAVFCAASRKPELSELAVLGGSRLLKLVFVVRQHRRPSMPRRNRLTPRPSGRRTVAA